MDHAEDLIIKKICITMLRKTVDTKDAKLIFVSCTFIMYCQVQMDENMF